MADLTGLILICDRLSSAKFATDPDGKLHTASFLYLLRDVLVFLQPENKFTRACDFSSSIIKIDMNSFKPLPYNYPEDPVRKDYIFGVFLYLFK